MRKSRIGADTAVERAREITLPGVSVTSDAAQLIDSVVVDWRSARLALVSCAIEAITGICDTTYACQVGNGVDQWGKALPAVTRGLLVPVGAVGGA